MPPGKNPKDAPPHHTPDFYIDDSRLDVGVKAFCNLVFDFDKAKLEKATKTIATRENQIPVRNCLQPKLFELQPINLENALWQFDNLTALCGNS